MSRLVRAGVNEKLVDALSMELLAHHIILATSVLEATYDGSLRIDEPGRIIVPDVPLPGFIRLYKDGRAIADFPISTPTA